MLYSRVNGKLSIGFKPSAHNTIIWTYFFTLKLYFYFLAFHRYFLGNSIGFQLNTSFIDFLRQNISDLLTKISGHYSWLAFKQIHSKFLLNKGLRQLNPDISGSYYRNACISVVLKLSQFFGIIVVLTEENSFIINFEVFKRSLWHRTTRY